MAAPLGNEFWKVRSTHGRKPQFQTPEILWDACVEYFQWVEDNPLYKSEAFAYQGDIKIQDIPLMRAMTVGALCLFLDISLQAWTEYRTRLGYGDVVSRVDGVIRAQKFNGAAAGLLNANIIARDLGLADRSEFSGPNGGAIPIQTDGPSARELAKAMALTLAKGLKEAGEE